MRRTILVGALSCIAVAVAVNAGHHDPDSDARVPLERPVALRVEASHVARMKLIKTYSFKRGKLDDDWAVYDTSYSREPDARLKSLVTVSKGALHVKTRGRKGSGLCACRGDGKPTMPYGRWDIRARASRNADHGFAILLWPNARTWPAGGEIDIAEFPGGKRTKLQTTVHFGASNRHQTAFTTGRFHAWHTYSVIWTARSIRYLLDGRVVMRVVDRRRIPTGAMHLALQAGPEPGVRRPSGTGASLDVAWIKVYR